jgi:hypothetical protein
VPPELDHVFVLVSIGAPEADRLVALGLTEGQPNQHPGQGTACRRFFFANGYLEMLWVANPEEARSEIARPLRIWERWSGRETGTCPFGIILRPGKSGDTAPPFPAWEYRPPYLPSPMVLYMGTNAEFVDEPLLAYHTTHRRPSSPSLPAQKLFEYDVDLRELTALRIFSPHAATLSPAMRAAEQTSVVTFHEGSDYLAEIGVDGEKRGGRADLRPALPLVMCW